MDESASHKQWFFSVLHSHITYAIRCKVPFRQVYHLRNPWNENRFIKRSRDGTEVEPSVGSQLLLHFKEQDDDKQREVLEDVSAEQEEQAKPAIVSQPMFYPMVHPMPQASVPLKILTSHWRYAIRDIQRWCQSMDLLSIFILWRWEHRLLSILHSPILKRWCIHHPTQPLLIHLPHFTNCVEQSVAPVLLLSCPFCLSNTSMEWYWHPRLAQDHLLVLVHTNLLLDTL